MIDPREDEIESEEVLSESSTDELADLEKAYEVKRKQILERKRNCKNSVEIERTRSKRTDASSTRIPSNTTPSKQQCAKMGGPIDAVSVMEKNSPKNASKFSHMLEASNLRTATKDLDLTKREFEFKNHAGKNVQASVEEKEPYSGIDIYKRYLPSEIVMSLFQDKKVLRVNKLFAKICPPLYQDPPYVNWCFIGIVLNKSEPKITKASRQNKKSKYFKIKIGDFKLSLDLYFFGEAFDRNWKIKIGDVIAVLNPDVVRWKPPYQGFHLSINSAGNTILEIGAAKNFGYCGHEKSDHTKCMTVINLSVSDLCGFHRELKYKQTQSKRMELNGSVSLDAPINKMGQKQSMFLRTNSKGNINGGYVDYESINQDTSNYYYEGGKLGKDYHNPKILDNLQAKRRRARDAKNNLHLEKRLLKQLNVSEYLKLGLIKNLPPPQMDSAKGSSFSSSTLSKIGFDPRRKDALPCDSLATSAEDRKRLLLVSQELSKISSAKQSLRKLSSSESDIKLKRRKWVENLKSLQLYRDKANSDSQGPSSARIILGSKNLSPVGAGQEQTSHELDSDVEIDFSNKATEEHYQKLLHGFVK